VRLKVGSAVIVAESSQFALCVQVGPSSPQPSVDRLSVSFAVGGVDDSLDQRSDRSDTSIKGLRGPSPYEMAAERVHFHKEPHGQLHFIINLFITYTY